MYRAFPLLALVLAVWAVPARAAETPAHVDLLADLSTLAPAQPLRLAVRFKLSAGRVIPWQATADRGKPPVLNWTMPAGFTAGDVEFPVPSVITLPDGQGDLVGYEKELVLLVPVSVPKELPPNGTMLNLAVSADFAWAGKMPTEERLQASVKVPVARASRPANEAAFRRWSLSVPQTPARDPTLASVNFHLKGEKMSMKVTWRQAVTSTQLLAVPDDARVVVAGKSTPGEEPAETNHELTVRDIAGKTPASPRIGVIIAYTTKDGQRRGVRLDIPVEAPKDE